MITLVSNNYEWIFSGIGVAILSLVFYTIKHYVNKKRKSKNNSNSVESSGKREKAIVIAQMINSLEERIKQSEKEVIYDNFDIEEFINNVKNVSPYQIEKIASDYIGLKIKLEVIFNSVQILPMTVSVSCKAITFNGHVYFYTFVEIYPIIKVLKEGTKLMVIGKIIQINKWSITLDCHHLEVLEEIPKA